MARTPRVEIKTSRLLLADLSPAEAPALFAYRREESVARFQSFHPKELGDAEAFIREATSCFGVPGRWFQLGIHDEAGEVIGDLGLHFLEPEGSAVEIGYTIRPDRQRRGYGREAVLGVLGYLFGELGKERAVASVLPGNAASRALLESLGFGEVAAHGGSDDPEGEAELYYELTRELWRARGED